MNKIKKWKDYIKMGINSIQVDLGHGIIVESPLNKEGICNAGISQLKKGYDISRSNFNCHVVIFTISGSGYLETPTSRNLVGKNKLMLVPAGNPARYFINENKWNTIWFDILDTETWSWLRKENIQVRDVGENFQNLNNAMKNLYKEMNKSISGSRELEELLAKEIVIYLKRELRIVKVNNEDLILEQLHLLFREINTKLQMPWTVESLAKTISMSSSHLHYLCKKHLKISPMGYVKQLRMEQAKKLLIQTLAPISDISYSIGYDNPLNFSTAFKKITGCSPKVYRKNNGE